MTQDIEKEFLGIQTKPWVIAFLLPLFMWVVYAFAYTWIGWIYRLFFNLDFIGVLVTFLFVISPSLLLLSCVGGSKQNRLKAIGVFIVIQALFYPLANFCLIYISCSLYGAHCI